MTRVVPKSTVLGVLCASIAIAGCGGGGGGDKAASPLDNALGYLPKDAPLVISIDTDLNGKQVKSIEKIVDKFPFAGQIKTSIRQSIESQSFNFEKDLKPLLGNEFVVGVTDPRSIVGGSSNQDFVGAIQAANKDKLDEAVKREKAKADGEKSGAKIYKDSGGDPFAIKDDVLIVAGSKKRLEEALAQREAGDRLTEATFDKGTAKLPKDALVRLYGDLQKLIASDPSTSDARKVKWVDSLRTFGLTASFKENEADVDFRLGTAGGLSDADLPIAAGAASPSLTDRAGEIGLGIRDPGQILKFGEDAGQAVDPSGFGDYLAGKRTVERRLGVSIDKDLLGGLKGDLSVTASVDGKFGARAEVKDPAAFKRTLAKLGKVIPSVARSVAGGPVGYAKPKKGQDFYALATPGGQSVVYGVVNGVFVIANDAKRAGQLTKESVKSVPGAQGSIVLNADAEKLVIQALASSGIQGGLGGALFAGPLGELTGSVKADPDGLTGNFKLGFD